MLGSGPMKRRFWQKFEEVRSLDGLWEIMARHLRCLLIAMDHGGIVETAYSRLSGAIFLILRVEEFSTYHSMLDNQGNYVTFQPKSLRFCVIPTNLAIGSSSPRLSTIKNIGNIPSPPGLRPITEEGPLFPEHNFVGSNVPYSIGSPSTSSNPILEGCSSSLLHRNHNVRGSAELFFDTSCKLRNAN